MSDEFYHFSPGLAEYQWDIRIGAGGPEYRVNGFLTGTGAWVLPLKDGLIGVRKGAATPYLI